MEQLSFEDAYEQLIARITALQDGKLPLDQALQRYEEGILLTHRCTELLQQAELIIRQLGTDSSGSLATVPLQIQ